MDRLTAGQQLNVNDQLMSNNGKVKLVMQGDGNLVLYRTDNNQALWASNTWNTATNHAVMQGDGNFVGYDSSGRAHWATGTNGHAGAYVVLQDDGNLVVYNSGVALWASHTVCSWDPLTHDSGNQHVDTGDWMQSHATVASTGLITGTTHIWCTVALRGFTGSVSPVLLDSGDKPIWPANMEAAKHQYGVDGTAILWGQHDRRVNWSNQVDQATLAQAKSLAFLQWHDPKNRLFTDIKIAGQVIGDIIADYQAVTGLIALLS